MPRHHDFPRPRRAAPLALLALASVALACGDPGTAPDGVPPVPCGETLGRVPGSTILYAGYVLQSDAFPTLDWSGDGSALLARAVDGDDPCTLTLSGTPAVMALSRDGGVRAARPAIPLAGETSLGTPTMGGRAVLYFTPIGKDATGNDVYGLVRVRFAGGADTLLRGTRRAKTTVVDTAGRVVAFVAPGGRRGAREIFPDTLVAVDVASGARRVVRTLDDFGYTALSMAPDGSTVHVGAGPTQLLIRLDDGAIVARASTSLSTPAGAVVATRWRPGGADVLIYLSGEAPPPNFRLDQYDVLRLPEGTRSRVARLRGVGTLSGFDWRADGTLLVWERVVEDEPPGGGGPGVPMTGAIRRFAPGDTTGHEVLRGTFRSWPMNLRVSPSGREVAFASSDFVGVAPLR